MIRHLAGPWQVGEKDRNDQPQVLGPVGQLVAVCAHECLGSREAEAEANAILIANAPKLLAACELAMKFLVAGGTQYERDAAASACINAVHSAIGAP